EEIRSREEILQAREDSLCRLADIFIGRVNSETAHTQFHFLIPKNKYNGHDALAAKPNTLSRTFRVLALLNLL
ncbi:MAG: hypothetical protein JAY75_20430, partial [Candidatus Thiodiazotropha taylori]|nr:hypothetical protein [Candidatus Thiodiazotropha taylori]MCW4310587.1 hypothetical protein [Candidatus Thiodiazotropha endolucinida]